MRIPNILITIVLCVFPASWALAESNETLTLTTYYPSPHGVYKSVRLFPGSAPVAAGSMEGFIYYDSNDHAMKYNNGTGWFNLSGDSYWKQSGTDVCANDVCLSQLKSLLGNQTLALNMHTQDACTAAGGTIVPSDVSFSICRFSGASCPTGWIQYKEFRAWQETTCNGLGGAPSPGGGYTVCYSPTGCTIPASSFKNQVTGTCGYSGAPCYCSPCCCAQPACQATVTQIGCY